jgi:hypothetical protein
MRSIDCSDSNVTIAHGLREFRFGAKNISDTAAVDNNIMSVRLKAELPGRHATANAAIELMFVTAAEITESLYEIATLCTIDSSNHLKTVENNF